MPVMPVETFEVPTREQVAAQKANISLQARTLDRIAAGAGGLHAALSGAAAAAVRSRICDLAVACAELDRMLANRAINFLSLPEGEEVDP